MAQNQVDALDTETFRDTPAPLIGEESSVDLFALFRRLREQSRRILYYTLGGLALATAIAFLLPSRYTSIASFIPPSLNNGTAIASAVAGQLTALGAGDIMGAGKTPGELYAGIIKSRSVADELVKQFDLMHVYKVKKESKAEKILGDNTAVDADPKSTIVTVSVTDRSPALAHDLADAYMNALRETEGRLALSQSSQKRLFFGQQLAKEKDDLEDAEVELKKTEEHSGLIAPAGQTESEIRTIAETRAQAAIREVQLAALRQSATDQNPEVIRLQSEIADLHAQLARLQTGSGTNTAAAIPTSKVPEVQLEFVRKEREVKYHEALFEMLSRQYEAARLDEAHDAPMLQVLDPASYPDTVSSPRRLLIVLGGGAASFFGICLWVLIRDRVHALRASAN